MFFVWMRRKCKRIKCVTVLSNSRCFVLWGSMERSKNVCFTGINIWSGWCEFNNFLNLQGHNRSKLPLFCFPFYKFLGNPTKHEKLLLYFWTIFNILFVYLSVHGVEYAFGAHEYPTTGIFEGEPKQCDGFTFRKTILIGKTDMGPGEVRAVMEEELAGEYRGNAYNLITKNCNHFCNDACIRLTGNPIPSWVNRLARIGKRLFG